MATTRTRRANGGAAAKAQPAKATTTATNGKATRKAPAKKAPAKAPATRREPGKITRHIAEVFAGTKRGTFYTVTEINKVVTEAYPGEARPGGGNLGKVIRTMHSMLPEGIVPATGGPRDAQGLRKTK